MPAGEEKSSPSTSGAISLYINDFQLKLKQLNEKLYVDTEKRSHIRGDMYSSGLYYKQGRRDTGTTAAERALVHASQRTYLEAIEAGELDKFICGVSINFVPEYDRFDIEECKILMPGYRTILMRLVKDNLISLDKARKVFDCPSLGESDYDKLNFMQKYNWAKENQG